MRAVKNALDNPLVDSSLANATCVLINFGGKPFLSDIKAGCEYLLSVTGSEISMFYSVETDSESEADQCVVTIFATENRETDRKN